MNTTSSEARAPARTSVRKAFTVAAPREIAFRVFTEKMTSWWPLATHHIGKANAVAAVIEPRVGGRWYERGEDGSETPWGKVLAWEPPARVVLAWQITADWQCDPDFVTEVEVVFTATGPTATRVDFEHRNLERYGARTAEILAAFDSDGGWNGLLQAFARAAAAGA